jgi:hypothetical protein
MGKTYQKNSRRFDDEVSSVRSGKHAKHSNNRKSGGMRTLNSYAEDEYDDYDLNNDDFDDEVGIEDDIQIQHNENTK